ncbi:class I SAM-dependent rRNA methyltransferase [Arhodomonas aquaeolei]|uniref:class I SAM-dependent rRNA methyltransferase n=1 Tax=Arhodomonas TaxID=2368 RepID=UPI0013D01357|nr:MULTISPECIES: class I SAM-dependent rRNA methyltransferase [Arhodomonas]MCS4502962.1 class I SAM-dependent rRNA methyltransferase [Arhodomonas aquaeolei]
MDDFQDLFLKKGEDRRLRAGHLWVFSNEVDTARSPLATLTPGAPVTIRAQGGRVIGSGYANPHSLICARLVSRGQVRALDESMLVHRLNVALSLRERLFDRPFYRLVHGEGDGLPGLVVDRFGDVAVVQVNTAGMEAVRDAVVAALQRVIAPAHILLRCDAAIRELEGLERYVSWAGPPGPETLTVEENGVTFQVPAASGQKTGWYYDHRANRAAIAPWVKGARVLDLFSYAGGWGIQAAAAGAAEVLTVDASRDACEAAAGNAEANGLDDRVSVACGDVLDVLQALRADRERFDVVIADPPAYIKRRRDRRNGLKAYRRLNQAALQVLEPDGLLASASCSAHLDEQDFLATLLGSARHLDRSLQVIGFGQQGPDHPVHPAIPETRYIKAVFARMLLADTTP